MVYVHGMQTQLAIIDHYPAIVNKVIFVWKLEGFSLLATLYMFSIKLMQLAIATFEFLANVHNYMINNGGSYPSFLQQTVNLFPARL